MEPKDDEPLCNCGECKYCIAISSSEYDYEGSEYVCIRCNGAGCTKCEDA